MGKQGKLGVAARADSGILRALFGGKGAFPSPIRRQLNRLSTPTLGLAARGGINHNELNPVFSAGRLYSGLSRQPMENKE
jgi:hypothetical protein